MNKIRVAVIMGGPSSEHDISLMSGRMVCDNLNKDRYDVIPVYINRSGEWSSSFENVLNKTDMAFLAMHGEYGEDGTIQKFLDSIGLPYTGSSAQTSALGMNKIASSRLFKAHGFNVPLWNEVSSCGNWVNFRTSVRFPVIVKPADRGSSIGVNIVRNEFGIREALCNAFEVSRSAIIQEYISGREITCAVIEDDNGAFSLPPMEIFPTQSEFLDYRSKYTKDAFKDLAFSRNSFMAQKEIAEAKRIALALHKIIGASGFSRTDMIIGNDGLFYILEINTIPGLTPTSFLLQSAYNIGISRNILLDKVIVSAAKKYRQIFKPFNY